MAVRTQCPRCKQTLSVPSKLAGSYLTCPRCQGRFWISKDSPADPSISDSVGLPSLGSQASPGYGGPAGSAASLTGTGGPLATPPLAVPPSRLPAGAASSSPSPLPAPTLAGPANPFPEPPRQYFPSVTPLAPVTSTVVTSVPLPYAEEAPNSTPAAPPQALKVARFVSADTAPSALKLAADGQLPQLQLQDSDDKGKGQGSSKPISPLVVIGVWVIAVALTVVIVMSANNDDASAASEKKKAAMRAIDEDLKKAVGRGELRPYQRLLRAARQANARGDVDAERQYLKQVLDLLHTESREVAGHLKKGISGTHKDDEELEEKILAMLDE
jgi:hypothetical protein